MVKFSFAPSFMTVFTVALAAPLIASPAMAKTINVTAEDGAQERLQEALILAETGDEIILGKGKFVLSDGLSLDVDGVTVRGAGPDATVLDFTGQQGSGEGLLVTSDNVMLRDFALINTKGDGIKSKGADNIVYYNLRVEWTGGPKTSNGAYGIYPVESENVLVDKAVVIGASDAGIYVGQSRNIIVRNSTALFNVAGIEIENSFDADVHSNIAMHNTGGILVFDLPNLPQQGGHNVRVFSNRVTDNDTPNFAPAGNIVASVPMGSGVMVIANRDVEIFGNVFDNNSSANVIVVGYQQKFDDPNYQPVARNVRVDQNKHGKAGYAPAFPGGTQLAAALGGAVPPIIWDGVEGEAANVNSSDPVPFLSLGLTTSSQPINEAQPAIVAASKVTLNLPAIIMPEAMEAKIR
ncbi:parallel beta-helix domain-containing protein [Parasphingorhabdus sp. DH2-15]|uniref:parallel beta-helix domain-containing protein n=1 Tax=Parasphingorhabdus sp. DH2-15 TaxID=3444112 RepID=UPI003F682D47